MPQDEDATRISSPKQAVLLIHGMGEQVPLGTLRDFVETVYQRDPRLRPHGANEALNRVWMVPDDATGTAELDYAAGGTRLAADRFLRTLLGRRY